MKYLFLAIALMAFQAQAKLVICESEERTSRGQAQHTISLQDKESEGARTVVTLASANRAKPAITHNCYLKRYMQNEDSTQFYQCKNSNGDDVGFWLSKDREMSWANYYGDITLNGMTCTEK